ncbi:hypothetical protein ZWY2020_046660 [Hordeum vulgare]|nr:hypothetical protein ZWY2020_046660 [Hordeum vulgare]
MVGSGTSTLFWFDRWAGSTPFAAHLLAIFSISVDPRISVEAALIDLGCLALRRPFGPEDLLAWHELIETVALHEPDLDHLMNRILWHLEPSGNFSMKSLYRPLLGNVAWETKKFLHTRKTYPW